LTPSRTLRAIAWVIALLPFSALRFFAAFLAFLAFDVLRIRRRHVVASLARAGLDPVNARGVYRQLGISALEFLWLSARPAVPATELMRIDGIDRFEAARAHGRGVIVATAHTGNWDLAACACAERTELSVVTKRLSSPSIDAFWQQTRALRGVDLIAAPDGRALRAIRDRLSAGRAVALLVDQDPERTRSVVSAPFLGDIAVHDTLAATIAARTGAPIVLAFARRDDRGNVLEIIDTIEPPEHPDRAWIEATTRAIAARLDGFVRDNPSAWLWLHRRWKTRLRDCDIPSASPTMAQ
jgi:KDO2-lipid IV(A) lauroyltransferase